MYCWTAAIRIEFFYDFFFVASKFSIFYFSDFYPLCFLSQIKIAIIGITAGGVGLDFSSAQHVVFLELPQSPSLMLQVDIEFLQLFQKWTLLTEEKREMIFEDFFVQDIVLTSDFLVELFGD